MNLNAAGSMSKHRPGAVVIGGDYQGLGIVRSLGRHGIPVCVIDDEKSIARFSRFTTHNVLVASLRKEDQTVEAILAAERRLGLNGWVLYPTRDETVAALALNRSRLCEVFRVPTPRWEIVKWAWDKRNTYRLADELGIPTPRTCYARCLEDLDQIDIEPPFALKPTVKEQFFYATKAKAWRANTRSELRTLFLRAQEVVGPGEVMIQDLIPGDGRQQFAYCAFFKEGQAIGKMVAQRRRQHPPEFGRASTFVETIELPLLEELSERFLRAIDYYGLVELEYKLDPRDGKYRLLDFNARTWGYHSLGQRAGVDFPYLLFADQMGEAVHACQGGVGVKWIRLITDVPTAVAEIFGGRQDWREYLRSVRDCNVEAVFSQADPLPGLAELTLFPYLCLKRGF
jgi:predicted ATP-grasp superfamily ATP-dependent carboligase